MRSCCEQHRRFYMINVKRGKYSPKELKDSQKCNHKSGNTRYLMNDSFLPVQLFILIFPVLDMKFAFLIIFAR